LKSSFPYAISDNIIVLLLSFWRGLFFQKIILWIIGGHCSYLNYWGNVPELTPESTIMVMFICLRFKSLLFN